VVLAWQAHKTMNINKFWKSIYSINKGISFALFAQMFFIFALSVTGNSEQLNIISPYSKKSNAYKGQLHCHTKNSDGAQVSSTVLSAYKNAGYDFCVITDHEKVTPSTTNISQTGILHIQGMEKLTKDSTGAGIHMIGIGVNSPMASSITTQQAIDNYLLQNALPELAHPSWTGTPVSSSTMLSLHDIWSIEIYNSVTGQTESAENKYDFMLSNKKHCFAVAVDDCHNVGNSSQFNKGWVMVFADNLTRDDILYNLNNGNFYASNGPVISSITLSGTVLSIYTVDISSIEFISSGNHIKQKHSRVTSDSYILTGNDDFIRMKITRISDGKCAWTNPVYVTQNSSSTDDDHQSEDDTVLALLPGVSTSAIFNLSSCSIAVSIDSYTFSNTVMFKVVPASPPFSPNVNAEPTSLGFEMTADGYQPQKDIISVLYYNDSTITGSGLNEKYLFVARYDDLSGKWVDLPSTVYANENKIEFRINHLSKFALFQKIVSTNFENIKLFPMPFNPSKQMQGLTIEHLIPNTSIKIFTISGTLVCELSDTDEDGKIIWDGRNSSGKIVASGVYIAVIGNSKKIKIPVTK
jgi:hypothetical protein